MSSRGDADRFAERRASLRAALSDEDVRAAARAASRLRITGHALTLEEFVSARAVRRTLGLALVKARMPKPDEMPLRGPTIAIPTARRSWRRLAAVAASALLVLIALFLFGGAAEPPGGGTPARAAEPQRDRILVQSRGRTVSLPQEVVVEESPTPTPSAEPTPQATAEPVAVAAPTAATAGSPEPSAGAGGSGGGNGGGNGSGSGSGNGAGSATPAPSPTPRVPPPGFSRLNVIVYDAQTRKPLEGVCIVIGTPNCGPSAPHTAADGRWSADVAASSNATKWQLSYIKTGYTTVLQEITLPGGVSRTYIVYLRRRG